MRAPRICSPVILALGVACHPVMAGVADSSRSVPGSTEAAQRSQRHPDVGVPPPAGTIKYDVREHGLYGELYVPTHGTHLPALIALGGAEGGLDTVSKMAVTLVPSGYAVLALAYFGEPGLPSTLESVPLEYFHTALAWLARQPGVDTDRLGLIGWSRGAEAALLVASREPEVDAVIAVSPSSYVWAGLNFKRPPQAAWTVSGKPLPYVTPRPPKNYRPGMSINDLLSAFLAEAKQRADAAIPVERIHGAILLICGTDDHLWPSTEMAKEISQKLHAAHFPHVYRTLSYPGAGHVAFVGNPASLASKDARDMLNPMLGGTLKADTAAWEDAWPKTLNFLSESLGIRLR